MQVVELKYEEPQDPPLKSATVELSQDEIDMLSSILGQFVALGPTSDVYNKLSQLQRATWRIEDSSSSQPMRTTLQLARVLKKVGV